jgi:type II secretory pathway pseudopilin PulG
MKVIIASEEDAWAALERATRGDGFPQGVELEFKNWPVFQMDVKGRDWNSTVPTRVMSPLLDVQKDINRAYANIKYSDFNLRKLKDEERDELEVVVKVEKGSSIFNAELWKQFSHMAEAAIGRMNGGQIVITVLGIALAITAPVMYRAWLASRQKEREIQSRLELSQQETERLKVFADAVNSSPSLKTVREDAQATHNRLLKAIKPGDSIAMKGVELKSDEVAVLVQPERGCAEDIFIEGIFVVLGNRTDKSDGFRITIKRLSDQLTLNADVPIELPYEQQQIIQKAEWSKGRIHLSITASLLRDTITQAIVGSAAEFVDPSAPEDRE